MPNAAFATEVTHQKPSMWNDPATASDEDTLGILIARHLEWDTHRIARCAIAALEDANWHTAAGVLQDLLDGDK